MFDYAGAHIWAPGLRHYLPRHRIFFFFVNAKIWVGRTTLNGEKKGG